MKKLLTSLLCVVMVMAFMPAMAFAAEEVAASLPAAENGVITLESDVVLSETATFSKNVTINGNGYTISPARDGQFTGANLIAVTGGTATLNNVRVDAVGACRAVLVKAGKLVVDGNSYITGGKASSYAHGVYVTGKAEFELKSGTISGNTGTNVNADYYDEYSKDLWIGANAKADISGGAVGYVFVNANGYSGQNKGGLTVSGGAVTNLYAETADGYDADCIVNGGTVENAMVSSAANLQSLVNATGIKTIQLRTDMDVNLVIPAEADFTLDLNGKTLNGGTVKGKATITNYGKVVINGNGTIKREDNNTSGYYTINNHGTMSINSGTVINNSNNSSLIRNAGLASDKDKNVTLNINGGTIEQKEFNAVKNDDYGKLNINGGTITSEHYAVQNWSNATIQGATINGGVYTGAWDDTIGAGDTAISTGTTVKGDVVTEVFGSGVTGKPEVRIYAGTIEGKLNVTEQSDVRVYGGKFADKNAAEYIVGNREMDADGNVVAKQPETPVTPNPGPVGPSEPVNPDTPEPPVDIEDPDTPLGPLPDEEVAAAVKSAKIKTTSKLVTVKGKKAIKLSWKGAEDLELDGYEVFRSVKKNSGYGKVKYFGPTSKTTYTNTKELKKGKTYYYKVRGYKMVGGQKVYTAWSTKAWRTVK